MAGIFEADVVLHTIDDSLQPRQQGGGIFIALGGRLAGGVDIVGAHPGGAVVAAVVGGKKPPCLVDGDDITAAVEHGDIQCQGVDGGPGKALGFPQPGQQQGVGGDLHVDNGTIPLAVSPEARLVEARGLGGQMLCQPGQILGGADIADGQGQKLLPAVTVVAQRGVVDREKTQGFTVEDPHRQGVGVEGLPVGFLLAAQLVFVLRSLGYQREAIGAHLLPPQQQQNHTDGSGSDKNHQADQCGQVAKGFEGRLAIHFGHHDPAAVAHRQVLGKDGDTAVINRLDYPWIFLAEHPCR